MTSSNNLKKFVSIGAALLLAVGGSLVAAQPALATGTDHTSVSLGGSAHIQASMASVNLGLSGCGGYSDTPAAGDFVYTLTGGTQTFTGVTFAGYLIFGLSSQLVGGETVTIAYTKNADPAKQISCTGGGAGLGDTVGSFTFTDTAPAIIPPVVSAASASAITDTGVTLNYSTDRVGNYNYSVRLASSAAPTATYLNAYNWGSLDLKHGSGALMSIGAKTASVTGLTAGTAYVAYVMVGAQALSNVVTISFTTTGGSTAGADSGASAAVTEAAKPLPTWAAPILKQIPSLSKTLTTDGGKLSLTDGDFSSLQSVTVGGKAVAYSIDAKGDVSIPVPAGQGGTTADLLVVFSGGKMLIQDGIKYVTPTDVAKVPEAPVAGFKANSSQVSGALAASILYAAQVDHKANAIACTGYAASPAQVALATARAEAACGYATGAYANLAKSTVSVVVNKAKAKSAAVGIKVYH